MNARHSCFGDVRIKEQRQKNDYPNNLGGKVWMFLSSAVKLKMVREK